MGPHVTLSGIAISFLPNIGNTCYKKKVQSSRINIGKQTILLRFKNVRINTTSQAGSLEAEYL